MSLLTLCHLGSGYFLPCTLLNVFLICLNCTATWHNVNGRTTQAIFKGLFFTKVALSHLANEKDWAMSYLVCRLWIREGWMGVPTPSFRIADHALLSLGGRDASAVALPKDAHPSILCTSSSAVHIHFGPFILAFLMGRRVESRDPR